VYGRGLIRRLPPMLNGDPQRMRMVYSLLFSLPGTPVLFYGEEIGLGENLDAGERMAVRPPMQWDRGSQGGFSTAAPARHLSRVVQGPFGPQHVSVEDQRRDPGSLLNFMSMLIRRYRESPELGWAHFSVLEQPQKDVLAHRCTWDDGSMVAIHNLGPEQRKVPIKLDDGDDRCQLMDLLMQGTTPLDGSGKAELDLDGYGYRWLRVIGRAIVASSEFWTDLSEKTLRSRRGYCDARATPHRATSRYDIRFVRGRRQYGSPPARGGRDSRCSPAGSQPGASRFRQLPTSR
jgi:hypothetical protein